MTSGNPYPSTLIRRLAGVAGLAVLLALAPRATATEALQNGSFADGTNNWQRSPELAAWVLIWLPAWPDYFPIGTNLAILHPVHGFLGPIVSQDLNVTSVAGADLIATITLSKYGGPPGPTNSIAVYADYVDADGLTNRILLQNPADASLPFATPTTVTNIITLPSSARTLVRYTIARLESGSFESSGVSLDVVTGSSTPELGLSLVDPTEGETKAAPFLLRAGVTNLTATVSSLVFCANGVPVGEGRLDPHGEWLFADGSRLSVMGGGGYEMVDLTEPVMGDMFFTSGAYTSQTNYAGGFQYFPSGGGMSVGAVSVLFSLDAAGVLTAAITGDAPLGIRTLTGGTNQGDTINYGFFWANASAGNYAITVRAVYDSGLSVTSAPVNITVTGSAPVVPPVLTLVPVASGSFAFQWDATIGSTYQVQTATNLVSSNWTDLGSSFVASNSPVAVTNSIGTDATLFFRVQAIGN